MGDLGTKTMGISEYPSSFVVIWENSLSAEDGDDIFRWTSLLWVAPWKFIVLGRKKSVALLLYVPVACGAHVDVLPFSVLRYSW